MNTTKKLTISAVLLALGLILPFFTGQIQEIGNKLLPMHIPILICGFVCGWKYGLITGAITPLLRCILFSMPAPTNAICMAFELATYGMVSGWLYQKIKSMKLRIYTSLLSSMISGRIIWGCACLLVYGITQTTFTWQMFIGASLLNAIPGIVVQLILVPILILGLEKSGVMNIDNK